jgi:hypothetical protein
MRKLFALAAMAVFALTLSLGTIGCAPKAEETPATVEETPAPAPEPAPMDTAMTDTTSQM